MEQRAIFFAIAILSVLCGALYVTEDSFNSYSQQITNLTSCQPNPIGICVKFTLLAGNSVIFNSQKSIILTGSLGVSPGKSIVGNYELLNGEIYRNSTAAIECAADFVVAYSAPLNCTCTSINFTQNSLMSRLVLPPGLYCESKEQFIFPSSIITFDGGNVTDMQWIFQSSSALKFSNLTSFQLINGASANNIFWRIGSDVIIGANSRFVGNILSKRSIKFGDGVVFVGRAIAEETISFEGSASLAMPLPVSTMEPSSAPSFLLTYPPTTPPSLVPTFTPQSPTPYPTTMLLVLIEVSQDFEGIGIIAAESKSFEDALQSSISQAIDLAKSDVAVTSVSNFATIRDGESLGNYTAVKVVYTITVANGNMSAITRVLNDANYTALLSELLQLNGFESASGSDVLLRDLSPTSSPTRHHYTNVNFGGIRIIIGSTIGIFGICFLVAYYTYVTDICNWYWKPKVPDSAVYYSDGVLSTYEINKMME